MTKRGPTPTPKPELLQHLRELADQLGETPTMADMDEHGDYSRGIYKRRFESWNEALKGAGLEANKHTHVTKDALVEDYQRVADQLGKTPSQLEYHEHGQYSRKWVENHFSTMGDLQKASGLERLQKGRVTKNCEECGEEYSAKASEDDSSRFCSKECVRGWKSDAYSGDGNPYDYRKVQLQCEWCHDAFKTQNHKADSARFCSQDCMIEWRRREFSGDKHPRWNGGKTSYRGPNWPRQRERALERDNHCCQLCPDSDDLHVHHIIPYDRFDSHHTANQLENLITLCQRCHVNVEWGNLTVQAKLTTPL